MNANDNPTPGGDWVMPPEEPKEAAADDTPPRPRRHRTAAKLLALVAASVAVGAGVSYAQNRGSDSTANAATANAPAAAGRGTARPPGDFGGGGGIAGEQHVQGAVTAKTNSTVTVKSSSGTATYTVGSTSQIVRDGQPATLADVKVGDAVLVHVYPSSGRMLVERLFAGTLSGGGFGPPARDDNSDGSTT